MSNIIKSYEKYLLRESATKNEVVDFLNEFGFFISMNLSMIQNYSIDDDSKNQLKDMQSHLRKPIINGKSYTELFNDMNKIVTNPKFLSAMLLQIKLLIEYIEPRIKKFVVEGEIKDKWLNKIEKIKKDYIKIIQ